MAAKERQHMSCGQKSLAKSHSEGGSLLRGLSFETGVLTVARVKRHLRR